MARGWESKSVESQIESAQEGRGDLRREPTPAEAERYRRKQSLKLAQTRLRRDLESCANNRYRELLEKALADVEGKLAGL